MLIGLMVTVGHRELDGRHLVDEAVHVLVVVPIDGAALPERGTVGDTDRAGGQLRSSRMSEAVIAPDSKSPESITLAKSADFLAFSAITFSSMVSLATNR